MGMLDFVKRKEFIPQDENGVELRCDRCSAPFMGKPWMVKKVPCLCTRCWRYDRLDEEAV